MSNGNYKRKTTNPNYDWSDQRRAEYSKKCKEAHANGTWGKSKSKRGVGRPRKKLNQDETKAVQNYPATSFSENLLETAPIPVIGDPSLDPGADPIYTFQCFSLESLFDQIEECLGIRPDLDEFINSAIEDKIEKVRKALRRI